MDAVAARAHASRPQDLPALGPDAFVHGYHVAFFWGAVMFVAALLATIVAINARRDDVPAEPALVAA